MKQAGQVIKLKPEKYDEFVRLHAATWPGVLQNLAECHIRNYSNYHFDGLLFSYFEYIGDDFEADMARIAADPITQDRWKLTDPCQEKVAQAREDEWWQRMNQSVLTLTVNSTYIARDQNKVMTKAYSFCCRHSSSMVPKYPQST
jgi:L-rhamnose mutarotase